MFICQTFELPLLGVPLSVLVPSVIWNAIELEDEFTLRQRAYNPTKLIVSPDPIPALEALSKVYSSAVAESVAKNT